MSIPSTYPRKPPRMYPTVVGEGHGCCFLQPQCRLYLHCQPPSLQLSYPPSLISLLCALWASGLIRWFRALLRLAMPHCHRVKQSQLPRQAEVPPCLLACFPSVSFVMGRNLARADLDRSLRVEEEENQFPDVDVSARGMERGRG